MAFVIISLICFCQLSVYNLPYLCSAEPSDHAERFCTITFSSCDSYKSLRKNLNSQWLLHFIIASNPSDLSSEELSEHAEKEKNKGNEAFRSGDYKEALVYYNRSIQLSASPAVHNNRAMAYIKLEEYQNAIIDCNYVLKDEPRNIKGNSIRIFVLYITFHW